MASLATIDLDWAEQEAWLHQQFEAVTDHVDELLPSEWAETRRYLPGSVSPQPGPYSLDVVPYMREILDCFAVDSAVKFVALMKGVQVTATTAAENIVGYYADHVKSAPIMWLTADYGMAIQRLQANILPMFQHSGLLDLIQSNDEGNARKTGKTDKKLEWVGGGSLVPRGCQNANGLRSDSFRILVRDEIDGYPLIIGKDGDPLALSEARTAAFEQSRKIFDLSTPTLRATSRIYQRFLLGDQRQYFICCLRCNASQTLKWRRVDKETGVVSGIIWETEGGLLVPGSARYLCKMCSHPHPNDAKIRFLDPSNGAEWRPDPNAKPLGPEYRSYHLSALYSPVGVQSWEQQIKQWLEAWDVERGRAKDHTKLRVFYNNILGKTFEETSGEKLKFRTVSGHRRREYALGQVPNRFAAAHGGGPIAVLTCSVDVHKDNLAVAVFGWSKGRRCYLVDYWRFEGDAENLDDPATWGRLQGLIDGKVYVADDGRKYPITITLVDSNYRADDVYRFVQGQTRMVIPVQGEALRRGSLREFHEFKTKLGQVGFKIAVDLYKDRWSSALKVEWDLQGLMPEGHFSAPIDVPDKALEELTREVRKEKFNALTGQPEGHVWHRPSGAANELWDTLVYSTCGLDMLVLQVSEFLRARNPLVLSVDYDAFFSLAVEKSLYCTAPGIAA